MRWNDRRKTRYPLTGTNLTAQHTDHGAPGGSPPSLPYLNPNQRTFRNVRFLFQSSQKKKAIVVFSTFELADSKSPQLKAFSRGCSSLVNMWMATRGSRAESGIASTDLLLQIVFCYNFIFDLSWSVLVLFRHSDANTDKDKRAFHFLSLFSLWTLLCH